MALLDNPAMYSSMMTSSYLLHHHNMNMNNRLNLEWSNHNNSSNNHHSNSNNSHVTASAAALVEEASRVARVAPSQRNSGSCSSANSSPNNNNMLEVSPVHGHTNLSSSYEHHHNHNNQQQQQQHNVKNEYKTGGGYLGSSPEQQCKIFGSKADLQLHTQIHMREAKPYKCSQCNKSFANSSYLSQHTRIHLGIKPYRCEICQRKFTQLSHLQQHIRTHTGDKPYKCRHPACTKAFSQLSNLQSHSRCHQTDKPYKCNSCYKCFVDETALLEHIPKHKESKHLKTHICQYCGKSYTQETYLAKHMQKHSDRPDKRPPILGAVGGSAAAAAAAASVSSAAAAAAAAHQSLAEAAYWPKVDPYAHHERDYQLMNHRDMSHHHQQQLEDLRQVQHLGYGDKSSSSSAFSPIQGPGGVGGGGGGNGNGMANFAMPGSRGYFYDPLSFPKHHSQVGGFDSKPSGANCFPNQLISLSQIRQYAHQPTSSDLLHSLKEKAGQVSQ